MSEFGAAQPVTQEPVDAALTAANTAILSLRQNDPSAAKQLLSQYEQIAHQHTHGLLNELDTIHALARLSDSVGRRRE